LRSRQAGAVRRLGCAFSQSIAGGEVLNMLIRSSAYSPPSLWEQSSARGQCEVTVPHRPLAPASSTDMSKGADGITCPHCQRTFNRGVGATDGRAVETLDLRQECERRGYWISHDDRLRERDAAELMGLRPKTLRNRRSLKDPSLPVFVGRRGRPLYAISSLAAWLSTPDDEVSHE